MAERLVDEKIETAFIFGSVAKGKERSHSDIDLVVVGSIGMRALTKLLSGLQEKLNREINPHIFTAEEFKKKVAVYKKEQEEIKAEAERIEALKEARNAASDHYYHIHHILSFAITFLQISIALASISALTRNKKFWLGSLVLSAIGAAIAGYCLVS
jgi:predicted nucleotidyltransferase